MANYILSLDSSTYANAGAAELAITNAGLAITKTYAFPLTYGVTGTTSQVAALAGVSRYDDETLSLTSVLHSSTADAQHLQTTAVNPNFQYYWHPMDTTLGEGQHIYLLDTGINVDHHEFSNVNNINNLYNVTSTDGFVDSAGHGTAMASLIAGNAIGAATNATLHNVKMFEEANGTITVGEVLEALDQVLIHHRANDATKPKVVCMPWVVTKNMLIDEKLNSLLAENLMLVASAGNAGNGIDVDSVTPGGLDTITTVGAFDAGFHVTSYTQLPLIDYVDEATTPIYRGLVQNGAKIDIFAIGEDVCVADSANVANYYTINGTSPAAAMVASVATHFMNLYSSTSAETIKSYMVTRGHEMASLPRTTSTVEEKFTILSYDNLVFPAGKTAEFAKVSLSILSVPMTSEITFTSIPSGRLMNVQHGQIATVNIGLDAESANVAVLDFSPLSPWMTFDAVTGIVTADTSNISTAPASIAPGVYHFAVKGTKNEKVYVEEYSIGVYETAMSELAESTEYYYDDDEDTYEEAILAPLVYGTAKT